MARLHASRKEVAVLILFLVTWAYMAVINGGSNGGSSRSRLNSFRIAIPPDETTGCHFYTFLHVGKGAGTTIEEWSGGLGNANRIKEEYHFRFNRNHLHVLGDDKTSCYMFTVRDPISRWVSGFWSEARVGCPDHYGIQDPQHISLIRFPLFMFPTPNALAEALSDPVLGFFARRAVGAIRHTRWNFEYYLPNLEDMIRAKRIPFVASVNTLASDIAHVEKIIGVKSSFNISASPHAHANSLQSSLSKLSPLAICNLVQLLKRDYELMDILFAHGLIKEKILPPACSLPHPKTIAPADTEIRGLERQQVSRSLLNIMISRADKKAASSSQGGISYSYARKILRRKYCFVKFMESLHGSGKEEQCARIVDSITAGNLYQNNTCSD